MRGRGADDVIAFILTMEWSVLYVVLPVNLITAYVAAIWYFRGRGRRPLEIAMVGLLTFGAMMAVTFLFMRYGIERPIVRFEYFSVP